VAPNFGPAGPANPNPPAGAVAIKDLQFDTTAVLWKGDLGKFLQEQVKPGDARVQVRVTGAGNSMNFTPVRLPEGTSLEVIIENCRVKFVNPPNWKPAANSNAEALIEVKGGDLVLNGVEIVRDSSSRPKYLVRVDGGHLILNRCRFTYPAAHRIMEPGAGHLISFRAPSSHPLPTRSWPFTSAIDRPVCRIVDSVLLATGDVLHAEVGRGMIALTQCLVEAGGTIFTLNPAKVARNRFEADLWVEYCTLAAEKTFVLLGPWQGSTPGPDRPWLVSSRNSAYMASYVPLSKESVLLRVEPNSLSQGTLFWQGYYDAYEVVNFTARNDKPIVGNQFPDVGRNWIYFWGTNHFRNSSGPNKSTKATVAFPEKLKAIATTANVVPGDLALDPDVHAGRQTLDLGADVRILQVPPTRKRPH